MLILPSQPVARELPMFYKLGETKAEVKVDTIDENRNAALSLAKQARHSIDIFTQDLDAEIYNNKAFEEAVFNLAKRHPGTRIRILVQDATKSIQNGHCLIRLAQTLTSSIAIHKPSKEHRDEKSAFLVVDQLGMLYRINANNRNFNASINFMAPQRAGKLADFFNEVWEHSTPDVQTRRMYM